MVLVAALALLPSLPAVADVSYSEQLLCEEAAAYIRQCCGTLGSLQCEYVAPTYEGCEVSDPGQTPSLNANESYCIRRLTCQELWTLEVCDAVRSKNTLVSCP